MDRSQIVVDIRVRQADVGGRRHIFVDFEFSNTGPTEARLERWLALDPPLVTLALLRINRTDRSPVRYIGRHINRRAPKSENYLWLRPGASRVVNDVDITSAYDWPAKAEKLTIWYEAFSLGHGDLELVQSASRELDYAPPMK